MRLSLKNKGTDTLKLYDNIIKKHTPLACAESVSLSLLTLDKSCDHWILYLHSRCGFLYHRIVMKSKWNVILKNKLQNWKTFHRSQNYFFFIYLITHGFYKVQDVDSRIPYNYHLNFQDGCILYSIQEGISLGF